MARNYETRPQSIARCKLILLTLDAKILNAENCNLRSAANRKIESTNPATKYMDSTTNMLLPSHSLATRGDSRSTTLGLVWLQRFDLTAVKNINLSRKCRLRSHSVSLQTRKAVNPNAGNSEP